MKVLKAKKAFLWPILALVIVAAFILSAAVPAAACYPTLGCLEITKDVILGDTVLDGTTISDSFTIEVDGPSGHFSQVFDYDGSCVSPDPWQLCDLIPGDYTITETSTGATWSWTVGGDTGATVAAGQTVCATVTNTFDTGCLEITKDVILGNTMLDGTTISDSFTIEVDGPSGHFSQVFDYDGSCVSPDPWQLCDLIPGDYTITETSTGAIWSWTVGGDTGATVTAGQTICATVTNTFDTGCLEITKEVIGLDDQCFDDPDADFTITVTGPSYPGGLDLYFHLVDGVVYYDSEMGATACLCGLIPGEYEISEIAPEGWEDAVIVNSPAIVEAGDECGETAVEVIVTNAPKSPSLSISKCGTWFDCLGECGEANVGETIKYIFKVTNTGEMILHNVTVIDSLVGVVPGSPIAELGVGESVTLTAYYTITQADIDAGKVCNTAIADSDETCPVVACETVCLPQKPALSIDKEGTWNDCLEPYGEANVGETITYTFKVTNTGNVTLHNVIVTDSLVGAIDGSPIAELAVGESVTLTACYTITQADIDAGMVSNTVTANFCEVCEVTDCEIVSLPQSPSPCNDCGDEDSNDVTSYDAEPVVEETDTANTSSVSETEEDNDSATDSSVNSDLSQSATDNTSNGSFPWLLLVGGILGLLVLMLLGYLAVRRKKSSIA